MPQFGLQDRPIQDGAVKAALDQDIITPLQGLSGGVWGMGVWRRYNLASLLWSASAIGATLTIPNNIGTLSLIRLGDNTMLVQVNCTASFTLVGVNSRYLKMQLPDGIKCVVRQPASPNAEISDMIEDAMIFDVTAGTFIGGYVIGGFFAPNIIHFAKQSVTDFVAGQKYNLYGQFFMEIDVSA